MKTITIKLKVKKNLDADYVRYAIDEYGEREGWFDEEV